MRGGDEPQPTGKKQPWKGEAPFSGRNFSPKFWGMTFVSCIALHHFRKTPPIILSRPRSLLTFLSYWMKWRLSSFSERKKKDISLFCYVLGYGGGLEVSRVQHAIASPDFLPASYQFTISVRAAGYAFRRVTLNNSARPALARVAIRTGPLLIFSRPCHHEDVNDIWLRRRESNCRLPHPTSYTIG